MARINPVVGEVSPNLYAAAVTANLSQQDNALIEQMAFTSLEAKRLRGLGEKRAKEEFVKLGKEAQDWLRYMYPEASWTKEDPSLMKKVLTTTAKGLAFFVGTPVVATFLAAREYGKTINTPFSTLRRAYQDNLIGKPNFGSPFAASQEGIDMPVPPNTTSKWLNAWKDGYTSRDLYDLGSLDLANKKHGDVRVYVAKGILDGKTPGEIWDEYGPADQSLVAAMTESLNEPESFNKVLEDVKYAQTSPGRDLGRMLERIDVKNGSLLGRFIAGTYIRATGGQPTLNQQKYIQQVRKSTGFIDAVYQVAIDPLTYITGGTSKSITSGQRLVDNLLEAQKRTGSAKQAVSEIFATRPEVRELWDGENQLGSLIRRFDEADTGEKVFVLQEIRTRFPAYNSFETIKLFADAKVFDSKTAEKFFGEFENLPLFISGRVDGITYYRNGIATARNQRQLSLGIARAADAFFNPGPVSRESADRGKELASKAADKVGIIKTLGEDITDGVNVAGIKSIIDAESDVKGFRRKVLTVGRLMSRNPAGAAILIGEDAFKTANTFRLVAQQAFDNRDIADFVTLEFLGADAAEQIVMLRNIYAMIMYRMGLHGIPAGKKLMNETLAKTFNNKAGMTTLSRTEVPKEFADVMNQNVIRVENESVILEARGIIHPSQRAEAIGPLPYERIAEVTAFSKIRNNDKSILKIVDGATRNKFVNDFVNVWTILTLVPRLGVRSAIDEAFFYFLNAPVQDIFDFVSRKGQRMGKIATGFTASKAAVGPYKRLFNKMFRKGGPEDAIPVEARITIPQEIANSRKIPVEEVTHLMVREEVVSRLLATFAKDPNINWDDLQDALVNNPHFLNSMANSLTSRTSLSGRFDKEIIDAIFTPSVLTKALNDLELKVGKKFRPISTEALRRTNPKWLTVAHHDTFFRQFVNNDMSLPNNRTLNPGVVFFSHNGLRTPADFAKAKKDTLEAIGVSFDSGTGSFFIKDAAAVKEYLSEFGDTVYFRAKGLNDAQIAEAHIDTMLFDMRVTFHGSGKGFNEELYALVRNRYEELVKYEKTTGKEVGGKWSKAAANVPFEDFEKATFGKQPLGDINTAIEFDGFVPAEDIESFWAKAGDGIMEQMDRQVTGLYRQPALMVGYSRLRESYRGLQKEFADIQFRALKEQYPGLAKDSRKLKEFREEADKVARKRFAEIAMSEAVESLLKYVDNPAVRTNFAMVMRTTGRFYRATEDFWRRYYRLMREKPLQVIYRMRLAHQGLEARGEIYKDEQGEPYLILPTDSIINNAVEPTIRQLTGSDFVVPAFNDVTMKLRLTNPSFAPDAGAPALSGPVAGIFLLGFKNLLNSLPGEAGVLGEKTGEYIDNWALGSFGDDLDLQRAVLPLMFQNMREIIPEEEITRQEATALFQSISYAQAFGDERMKLPENATAEQKHNFLRAHKIAAHNVRALRAVVNTFFPSTLTLRESKGIPKYYKNNGVITLRQEFFDILNKIDEEDSGNTDPYELALAIFNGKFPGKTIYTINRNEKKTKFVIQKTNEVVNWAITNKSFIKEYGDAAWIFAPQIGDYTPDAFSYLEALDIVEVPSKAGVLEYLDRAQVAMAKKKYFDIERAERDALASTALVSERRTIINNATAARQALLSGNPLLAAQLEDYGIGVSEEIELLGRIEEVLRKKDIPVGDIDRKKVSIAVNLVREFISFANDPNLKANAINFVEAKRGKKEEIERILKTLGTEDKRIKELNRRIFEPILGFYSRDVYRVLGGR